MSAKVPAILVRYTTPEERSMIAKWVREAFDLDIDWHADVVEEDYKDFDVLLLGILEIADILSEHGYGAEAERLIEERVERDNDTDLLH